MKRKIKLMQYHEAFGTVGRYLYGIDFKDQIKKPFGFVSLILDTSALPFPVHGRYGTVPARTGKWAAQTAALYLL